MIVAVLTADLFEDVELWYPYYRLQEAGAEVALVGCEAGTEHPGKRGTSATATVAAEDVAADDLAAVVIPGGYSPDHMRRCASMVELVRAVGESAKPVAAICHGPWMLASAGLLRGRRATSFYSLRDDVENAGAEWVDEEVVEDGNIITSRKPADLPVFMRTVVAALERQPVPAG